MMPNLPTEILDFYLSIAVSDYSICSVKTIKAYNSPLKEDSVKVQVSLYFLIKVKITEKIGSVVKVDGKYEVLF